MDCGADLEVISLTTNMEMQQIRLGRAMAVTAPALLPAPPVDYQVDVSWTVPSTNCPV